MSAEVIGALAPAHHQDESTIVITPAIGEPTADSTIDADPHSDKGTASKESNEDTGLHSPPDSNNAMKLDGSDSELSDLDDVADESAAPATAAAATADADTTGNTSTESASPPKKDIGDIAPDHWSGTVPVFKPSLDQFEDFKLFVRSSLRSSLPAALSECQN
jgi:hypothetical protein